MTNVKWLLDMRKDGMNKISSLVFLLAKKGLSNDDVSVARGTVFEEIRPGAAFETGDFVEEKLGGLP